MIPQSMGACRDVLADKVHWAGVANGVQPPSEARLWDTRGQIIAQFVRPGDKVLDLGAGKQKLKSYLPATCSYVPVDCVAVHPGTFVVDFNEEFRLPKEPVDVIVSSGFLEYIVNLEGFMRDLALAKDGCPVVFSYYYSRDPGLFPRPQSPEECYAVLSRNVAWLREVLRFGDQSLFTGVLSSAASLQFPASPMMITDALSRPPRPSFLERRWRQLTRLCG